VARLRHGIVRQAILSRWRNIVPDRGKADRPANTAFRSKHDHPAPLLRLDEPALDQSPRAAGSEFEKGTAQLVRRRRMLPRRIAQPKPAPPPVLVPSPPAAHSQTPPTSAPSNPGTTAPARAGSSSSTHPHIQKTLRRQPLRQQHVMRRQLQVVVHHPLHRHLRDRRSIDQVLHRDEHVLDVHRMIRRQPDIAMRAPRPERPGRHPHRPHLLRSRGRRAIHLAPPGPDHLRPPVTRNRITNRPSPPHRAHPRAAPAPDPQPRSPPPRPHPARSQIRVPAAKHGALSARICAAAASIPTEPNARFPALV
jgi:hypothetical protein